MSKGNGGELLDWDGLEAATRCLKTVAHPVRLRILELLLTGEHTVGELAELCEVEQWTASEHLGRLRDRGILSQERRGRKVYYKVLAPSVDGIVRCMQRNFGSDGTEMNGSVSEPQLQRRR
jgi:DNA-binding transcriptional ArsR family regulator